MIQEALLQWQYQDTENGLIMPWYTLPCLQWLKKQDTKQWIVFEYGSGYSTIWWRANCAFVQSVESVSTWASAMKVSWAMTESEFISACASNFQWDCIIVDGFEKNREKCVDFCVNHLKSGGYLIIDNWESEDYDPKVNEKLLKHWPRTIYQQPNHSTWKTAVLYKP